MSNDLRAARQLRGQGQQFDVAAGGLLQAVKICDVRRSHVPGVMRATVSGFRRKPRALEMVAADRGRHDGIPRSDALEVFEFRAQRWDGVGDERQKKPPGLVCRQPVHCAPEIGGGQIGLLEIHARKPVDLDIKEAHARKG